MSRSTARRRAPGWTPASDADTALWLDPTYGKSGLLWKDRTRNTSCTVNTSPAAYADFRLGGKPGVEPYYVGAGATIRCPIGSLLSGATGFTLLFVGMNFNDASGYVFEYGNGTGTTTQGRFAMLNASGGANRLSMVAPGGSGANRWDSAVDSIDSRTPKVFSVVVNYGITTDSIAAIRMNGVALSGAYAVNTNPAGTTLGNETLYISGQYDDTDYSRGTFGDIIVVERALNSTDLATFEGFLATKYGLPFSMVGRRTPRIVNCGQSNSIDTITDLNGTTKLFNGPWENPRTWAYRHTVCAGSDLTETWQGANARQFGVLNTYGWPGTDMVAIRELVSRHGFAPELIDSGRGSTSLAVDWAPGGTDYNRLVTAYTTAISTHPAPPVSPEVVVRFGQGESDTTNATWASNYGTNLATFWSSLKTAISAPNAKIVIDLLRPDCTMGGSTAGRIAQVRSAQEAFIAADPANRFGLNVDAIPGYDGIHFSQVGMIARGYLLAAAIKAILGDTAPSVWDPLTDGTLATGLVADICPAYSATLTMAGTKVAKIVDRTGNGNDFEQTTDSKRPTLTPGNAAYGGRSTLLYSGAQELISTAAFAGMSGIGTNTVAIVFNNNATSTQALVQQGAAYPPSRGMLALSNGTSLFHQTYRTPGGLQNSYSTTIASGTKYRYAWTTNINATQAVAETFRNGSSVSSSTGVAGTAGTFGAEKWMIGSGAGTHYVNGTIARVLVWNRVLSAAEITQLDNGLKSFFSLP